MIFQDRIEAGKNLAKALNAYQDIEDGIVIGLPRGGIPVAFEVSQALNLPLDIVCPRKIGAPFNREYAIGAVTETGEAIYNQFAISEEQIPESYLKSEVEKETLEAQRRLALYRSGKPKRELCNKSVILVDDGIATGSTMQAAIRSIRKERAKEIVVAIPVSSSSALEQIKSEVDNVVCLYTPPFFQAVGEFYYNFGPTRSQEVIELMKKASA